MARTIKEIKKSMTDKFLSDEILRKAYGIKGNPSWQDIFSSVSVESILLYIVAVCAYTVESLFDNLKADVNKKIDQSIVASVGWYHHLCLSYQHGDSIIYDDKTSSFGYKKIDQSKQIVKYAAVRDTGGGIQVLVSKDKDGVPTPLNSQELQSFTCYINKMKIAGVSLNVKSLESDKILINLKIVVDKMVIDTTGKRISDQRLVVVEAVKNYLSSIVFGGVFNKTKLIDAVQNVEGVIDVQLLSVRAKPARAVEYRDVENNNYVAVGGSFQAVGLESSMTYE